MLLRLPKVLEMVLLGHVNPIRDASTNPLH